MAHSMQGVYAPLPQSLSDSDSEKEITMDPICTQNCNNSKMPNFDTGYRTNGINNHLTTEIINMKSKKVGKKMSTARKAAFIFSIILCFLPIVIFLYILPCSELSTCPIKIANWEYSEPDIELKGAINIVNGLYRTTFNLAVLYKGSFNSEKKLKNGIISLMGTNGAVAWDFGQEVEPKTMDCNLIDVDNNGNFDCLISDTKGLKAVETVSGQSLWHANSKEEVKIITNLDFPIKLQDLNNDGIPELLSIYRRSSLLLLSGKDGKALKNINISNNCNFISNLNLVVYANVISFNCNLNSNGTKLFAINLSDFPMIYKDANYNYTLLDFNNINPDNVYESGKRKLVVENNIKSCKITLYNDKHIFLKSWSYKNCAIMTPKPFNFAPTTNNMAALKGHINGFIIKIWQWNERYKKLFDVKHKLIKRSLQNTNSNSTYYLREVKERVILITFNESDIHVINASLIDVNQICFNSKFDRNNTDYVDDVFCQPDHRNQQDSLLVADLDHDKSQELINFYSSYEKREDFWELMSYLKIFRLEEELPKLYGSK